MVNETCKRLVWRLQSVEGHVGAIQRVVDEGAYCIFTIKPIDATKAGITKTSQIILEDNLSSCVTNAVRGDGPAEPRFDVHGLDWGLQRRRSFWADDDGRPSCDRDV